jgi:hypothetical protein
MAYFNLSLINPKRHSYIRKHLLWDFNQEHFDYQLGKSIVVERVVQRGNMDDWLTILNLYGYAGVRAEIMQIPYLNVKDMNFVHIIFRIPLTEMKCYKSKQSPSRRRTS